MQQRSTRTKKMVVIALFGAMAAALMFIEFPMGFLFPAGPFLNLDISTVPIMIGSFMYGPLAGVIMAFIKAAIHFVFVGINTTMGVGDLVDFIITASFALTAGFVYRRNRTRKGAVIAMVASVFVITVVGALTNYFIAVPLYARLMNFTFADVRSYILFAIVPFNLLKGTIVSVITFLVYKRLSGWLRQFAGPDKKAKPARVE